MVAFIYMFFKNVKSVKLCGIAACDGGNGFVSAFDNILGGYCGVVCTNRREIMFFNKMRALFKSLRMADYGFDIVDGRTRKSKKIVCDFKVVNSSVKNDLPLVTSS